jgi:hypothetical protein
MRGGGFENLTLARSTLSEEDTLSLASTPKAEKRRRCPTAPQTAKLP